MAGTLVALAELAGLATDNNAGVEADFLCTHTHADN